MLSAVQTLGACLLIIAIIFGEVILLLTVLIRIKQFVLPPTEFGPRPWRPGLRQSLAALVRDAREHPRRFWATIVITAACVYFAPYILLGLMAVGVIALPLAPLARKYNWGSEGRLTRHLSRPPFEDETRRATQ
jgi:hypothetical protein